MPGEPKRRYRYAPTPSRELHVGNALSAVIGWAAARAHKGDFILRIEDIDRQRCKTEYEEACLRDLEWLGLDWDEGPDVGGEFGPYRQSSRFKDFDQVLRTLNEQGLVYRCICSRSDLAQHTRAPHATSQTEQPYPGTCRTRKIDPNDSSDRGGYRLCLSRLSRPTTLAWHDEYLGPCSENLLDTCGDFLLGRWGKPTYQLAAVTDDIHMQITHVVRGKDLASSSARQIILHQTLGNPPPVFSHHPLLLDKSQRKLSKRDQSATISGLREAGVTPNRLLAELMSAIGVTTSLVKQLTADDCVELLAQTPNWRDGEWSPDSL